MKALLIALTITALSVLSTVAGENCGNPACQSKAITAAADKAKASAEKNEAVKEQDKEKATACQKTPSRKGAIADQKQKQDKQAKK